MPRDLTDNGSNSLSQGAGSTDHDVHVPLTTQHHELTSTQEALSEAGSATVGKKESEEQGKKDDLSDEEEEVTLSNKKNLNEKGDF